MTTYVYPKRAWASEGVSLEGFLKKQTLSISLTERETTDFGAGEYVILDFGVEICGGIRILSFLAENVEVRVRFGESLGECQSELGGKRNATNDHSLRDFKVRLQNFSDMVFGQTGFRFVRLDFGGPARIKCAVAESRILKKKAVYRYEGEDQRISEIYKVAKRTVDLCASSGYLWDGIKRDRLVWIGDLAPEIIALTTLYGRLDVIERSLDFMRERTPLPGNWMNTMPMYSLWWIIDVAEYYERTGADGFARRQMPYLTALLSQLETCIKEDGALDFPSYFVDWPTHGQRDELAGCRAICVIAMKKAILMLDAFGLDAALARTLLARLLKVEIHAETSKQVLGLKHFATGLSEKDKEKLLSGGAKGMSTFMSYYILKAVASFDRDAAVRMMKEYYGAMLDVGATSFWEDFDIEWTRGSSRIDEPPRDGEKDIHGDYGAFCYVGFRHSLCHGWSAGVIGFMKEEL